MRRTFPTTRVSALTVVLALLAGCATAASYDQRMQHLDKMTEAGIAYRAELQRQGTEPTAEACIIGWDLLDAYPPADGGGWSRSEKWIDQNKEAYVKGCMTGQARPKPDPSGINAVTPVPVGSEHPRSSLPSPSPS